jgi:hypothetical protein
LARKLKKDLEPGEIRTPPIKLATIGDVLSEMQKCYRAARCGKLPSDDMGRLLFGLREIRATLESAAPPVIENGGGGDIVVISVVGVPHGGHLNDDGRICYPDGVTAPEIPWAPFVPSPDLPESEPAARILQLEERVAQLEARNRHLEWTLDPRRAAPPLLAAGPHLIVDNADVDRDDGSEPEPSLPPGAA